jgi:3-hexulose-6-phosphate synthase
MSKLQLALDDISLEDSIILINKIRSQVDIIEVGTPLMMAYGMEAVSVLARNFPNLDILCDAKIMDAGAFESNLAFNAGASYVTVLGVTDDLTIIDCLKAAQAKNRKVMVDMICVNHMKDRVERLDDLGVDVIAVHTGVDQQAIGRTPLDDLKELKQYVKKAQIAVAGGINSKNIDQYLLYQPDIIIVGGGIINANDQVKEAQLIADKIRGVNQ